MAPSKKLMTKKLDLLCIGDSCVDIFSFPDETKVRCQLHNGRKCELCIAYASKIPTKGFTITFGGNAANVAVGASRLGVKTAIYTHLGDDLFGKAIVENFRKEKVDTSLIRVDEGTRSNANIVLSAQGDRTILSYHEGRDYCLPSKTTVEWLYFSSLAAKHGGFNEQLRAHIVETGAKLVFNPGSYQIKEGRKALAPLLEVCEVLIVNRDEATRLLEVDCAVRGEKECLQRLCQLGPRFVVVTDGPHGAYGFGEGGLCFQKAYPLGVVERTGAGDAFSAGLVVALMRGKNLKEALRWGTVNAAFVVQKVGAQAGLLTRRRLEKALAGWK